MKKPKRQSQCRLTIMSSFRLVPMPSLRRSIAYTVFWLVATIPTNPDTGDPESFLKLNDAFHVLSDPQRRKEYDEIRRGKPVGQLPEFESVDFMDGIEGETNRRLAVLAVLYRRCRTNVADPKVALPILEKLMGFPREYLDFTTWYLRTKRYINREDNSDFSLTVLGVGLRGVELFYLSRFT